MSENANQTTPESLGLIQIGEGVYARLRTVTVVIDLVDAQGNAIQSNGFAQSQGSIIKLQGSDLAGLELPVQAVANKIYNLTQNQ